MSTNALGPYFLKLFYKGISVTHVQTLPTRECDSSQSGDWQVLSWAGDWIDLPTAAQSAAEVLAGFQVLPGDVPIMIGSGFFQSLNGAVNGPGTPMLQQTVSFKTGNSSRFRWCVMEGTHDANLVGEPPFPPLSPEGALTAYMISPNGFVCSRGDGRPIAPIKTLTKTNDHLRRVRDRLL